MESLFADTSYSDGQLFGPDNSLAVVLHEYTTVGVCLGCQSISMFLALSMQKNLGYLFSLEKHVINVDPIIISRRVAPEAKLKIAGKRTIGICHDYRWEVPLIIEKTCSQKCIITCPFCHNNPRITIETLKKEVFIAIVHTFKEESKTHAQFTIR